jgi:hypothetical protein
MRGSAAYGPRVWAIRCRQLLARDHSFAAGQIGQIGGLAEAQGDDRGGDVFSCGSRDFAGRDCGRDPILRFGAARRVLQRAPSFAFERMPRVTRRILQIDGSKMSVSAESRFDAERDLHEAIAAHPEVLPSEDLGLGPLVALGTELDFGPGPLDLLAVDPQGHIVIVEFKRGSENPDVRKVVAQVLDYGASLWRTSYDELGRSCAGEGALAAPDLAAIASERFAMLDVAFDLDTFQAGVETALDTGEFVFLYVGRDLDERTRRIMTYLAEGPRMRFFAVEVDYFRAGEGPSAVLVPRTAFVPSWIAEPSAPPGSASLASAAPEFHQLLARMDGFAAERGLMVNTRRTGRNYEPRHPVQGVSYTSGVGIYCSGRGAEFNLLIFRELGRDDLAEDMLRRIADLTGTTPTAARWPSFPWEILARDWDAARSQLLEPYFDARDRIQASGRPA